MEQPLLDRCRCRHPFGLEQRADFEKSWLAAHSRGGTWAEAFGRRCHDLLLTVRAASQRAWEHAGLVRAPLKLLESLSSDPKWRRQPWRKCAQTKRLWTAPLQSLTPQMGIPASRCAVHGFLSSCDWQPVTPKVLTPGVGRTAQRLVGASSCAGT